MLWYKFKNKWNNHFALKKNLVFSDKAQLFLACQNYEFSKLLVSVKNHYF